MQDQYLGFALGAKNQGDQKRRLNAYLVAMTAMESFAIWNAILITGDKMLHLNAPIHQIQNARLVAMYFMHPLGIDATDGGGIVR